MDAQRAGRTKRVRKMRRNVRRLVRDRVWAERRLRVEKDPEMVLELRETIAEIERASARQLRGIEYQESRLPPVDGPDDCFLCHTVIGDSVPVAWQRIFEDGLRATGLPPETVWNMPEYRPPKNLIGHGRGCVSIVRARHADHADSYQKAKAEFVRDGKSGGMF
jgi:hypothetical protein